MKNRRNAIYPWSMWYWTQAHENLFDMDKITLYTFRLLIDEANKVNTTKD